MPTYSLADHIEGDTNKQSVTVEASDGICAGLTGSKSRQGTVLVQPGESRSTQVFHAGSGNHPIVGLEQRLNDDTELTPS